MFLLFCWFKKSKYLVLIYFWIIIFCKLYEYDNFILFSIFHHCSKSLTQAVPATTGVYRREHHHRNERTYQIVKYMFCPPAERDFQNGHEPAPRHGNSAWNFIEYVRWNSYVYTLISWHVLWFEIVVVIFNALDGPGSYVQCPKVIFLGSGLRWRWNCDLRVCVCACVCNNLPILPPHCRCCRGIAVTSPLHRGDITVSLPPHRSQQLLQNRFDVNTISLWIKPLADKTHFMVIMGTGVAAMWRLRGSDVMATSHGCYVVAIFLARRRRVAVTSSRYRRDFGLLCCDLAIIPSPRFGYMVAISAFFSVPGMLQPLAPGFQTVSARSAWVQ